jgi:hypothetical protein
LFIAFSALLYAQPEPDSTVNVQSEDSSFVMQKSPWGAVLRSAVLPGWGQFYNESYWKIPIFVGLMGYFGYSYFDNNNQYETYRDLYLESLETSPNGNLSYRNLREFYKDQRDLFAIYFFLTYFLNMVDAYVDAHLFDFDVSEDPVTKQPQLNIRYNF